MTKQAKDRRVFRQKLFEKYEGRCAYCGAEFAHVKRMQVDHVIPVSKGGDNSFDNLNPACIICNNYKSALLIEEFRSSIANIREQLCNNYTQINFCFRIGVIEFKREVIFYFERCKKANQEKQ